MRRRSGGVPWILARAEERVASAFSGCHLAARGCATLCPGRRSALALLLLHLSLKPGPCERAGARGSLATPQTTDAKADASAVLTAACAPPSRLAAKVPCMAAPGEAASAAS